MGSIAQETSTPGLKLVSRFIDEPRALRVTVIGGGLSGINAGILIPAKVPNVKLTIYEKNKDFAGTWLENVYPGVRCDIPSHVYQSTFSPNREWTDQFSFGPEIRDYWQGVARKYDVYKYAKFNSKVESAEWDADKGEWTITIRDVASSATFTDTADVVITALGRFNNWKLPDYPGIHEYKGHLRHVQNYDPTFEPAGKSVAVIGNGASGIQLTANLQPQAARLDHYVRNRTWIAASWAGDERTFAPQPYSEEQIAAFKTDPAAYLAFRKELEAKYWRRFTTFLKNSKANEEIRQRFIEIMKQRVAKKPELLQDLIPDFSPNCRRLTPGPGYLEAISADNVDYIRTPIKRFTATGIETVDGKQRDVDAVICATGAYGNLVPPFEVRAHGHSLGEVWGPTEQEAGGSKLGHGIPWTYLGVSTPGFPNFFYIHGPNSSGPSGTVPHSVETQVTYLARILRKVASEGIKSIDASAAAADEFIEYAKAFFETTVLTDNCSSWYNGGKPGGFIHSIWPGSSGHLTIVRQSPRWEDFEYTYLSDTPTSRNRFVWYLGSGYTKKEADPESDIVPYLREPVEHVDLRDIHEQWYSFP